MNYGTSPIPTLEWLIILLFSTTFFFKIWRWPVVKKLKFSVDYSFIILLFLKINITI